MANTPMPPDALDRLDVLLDAAEGLVAGRERASFARLRRWARTLRRDPSGVSKVVDAASPWDERTGPLDRLFRRVEASRAGHTAAFWGAAFALHTVAHALAAGDAWNVDGAFERAERDLRLPARASAVSTSPAAFAAMARTARVVVAAAGVAETRAMRGALDALLGAGGHRALTPGRRDWWNDANDALGVDGTRARAEAADRPAREAIDAVHAVAYAARAATTGDRWVSHTHLGYAAGHLLELVRVARPGEDPYAVLDATLADARAREQRS